MPVLSQPVAFATVPSVLLFRTGRQEPGWPNCASHEINHVVRFEHYFAVD
jgi:hypothetical protein